MDFTPGSSFGKGLNGLFQGMFGPNPAEPYQDAEDSLQNFYNQAQGAQNPFYQAGIGAIPQYQQWLSGQQDPSQFINKIMGQYQESPYAKYLQDKTLRTGMNAASAGGVGNMGGAGLGSTPFLQQAQENSANISSGDMQNWLSHVLGINTQYGQGTQNLMTGGHNAANTLSQLAQNFGQDISQMKWNEKRAQQDQSNDLFGGLFNIGKSLFGF